MFTIYVYRYYMILHEFLIVGQFPIVIVVT